MKQLSFQVPEELYNRLDQLKSERHEWRHLSKAAVAAIARGVAVMEQQILEGVFDEEQSPENLEAKVISIMENAVHSKAAA